MVINFRCRAMPRTSRGTAKMFWYWACWCVSCYPCEVHSLCQEWTVHGWQWQWHTQRSPTSVEWRPGLTGKSVGVITPQKKNLFHWCNLLIGKVCKYKLLWTECSATRPEMDSMHMQEENQNKGHKQLLCWILKLVTESSDSEQHHRHNNKKRGSQETRRGRPGNQEKRKHPERGRQDTSVQHSCLI